MSTGEPHITRAHRWFGLLRWSALIFALAFALSTTWFVFRIEKFILARLPPEISIGKLSVSFLNRQFVLTDVQVSAGESGACKGAPLLRAARIDGGFYLRARQLHTLKAVGVELTKDATDRRCLDRAKNQAEVAPSQYIAPEGLVIDIQDALVPAGEIGTLKVVSALTLKNIDPRNLQIGSARLLINGKRLSVDVRKLSINIRRTPETYVLQSASASLTARYADLSKMPRLTNSKFHVNAGNAELKMTAVYSGSQWSIVSGVDLKAVKVSGESLFKMPMGLLQLTPQNMWPMAEDAPGLLAFEFSTIATPAKLAATYAADLKNALRNKIRGNLKKKFPILPF